MYCKQLITIQNNEKAKKYLEIFTENSAATVMTPVVSVLLLEENSHWCFEQLVRNSHGVLGVVTFAQEINALAKL